MLNFTSLSILCEFELYKRILNGDKKIILMRYFQKCSIVMIGVCVSMPQQQFGQFDPFNFNNQQQFGFNNNNQPQQPPPQQQPQPTPTAAPAAPAAPVLTRAYYRCFDSCPTLSTYNPVCGSDGNNYHNAQKLDCHNSCGREQNPTTWTGKCWITIKWNDSELIWFFFFCHAEVTSTRGGTCQPLG